MANAKPVPGDERLYPVTWDEVKEAELDDALRATPAQRLAWLEDALKLAWAAGAVKGDADRTEQSAVRRSPAVGAAPRRDRRCRHSSVSWNPGF